jgi:hypothetical protein
MAMQTPNDKVFRGGRKRQEETDPLWEQDLRESCYFSFSCDRIEESLRMLERLNAKAPAGELPQVTVKVECLRNNGSRVLLGESGGTKIGKSRGNNVAVPPANISLATIGPEDFLIITAQAGGIIIGARRWSRENFLREWLELRNSLSMAPGESLPWRMALHTNTELLDKFSSATGPMQMLSPVKSPGMPAAAGASVGSEADAAVADPPADPATAVFITTKVDVRFKNAGVLALSVVSIEGLKAGSSAAKVRVTTTKEGKATTAESGLSKSPLPNASWGKEGASLDSALRLFLEPDNYSSNLQLSVLQDGDDSRVLASCCLQPSQVSTAAHVDMPMKLTLTADGCAQPELLRDAGDPFEDRTCGRSKLSDRDRREMRLSSYVAGVQQSLLCLYRAPAVRHRHGVHL